MIRGPCSLNRHLRSSAFLTIGADHFKGGGSLPYSCSKHATLALITGGAKALVDHNITVNGYGPSVVRTKLWEQLDKDLVEIGKFEKEGQSMDSLAENMILMKRYSYPEDVVGTASFLASADSDYMTGQLIMIDGGMIMQ